MSSSSVFIKCVVDEDDEVIKRYIDEAFKMKEDHQANFATVLAMKGCLREESSLLHKVRCVNRT